MLSEPRNAPESMQRGSGAVESQWEHTLRPQSKCSSVSKMTPQRGQAMDTQPVLRERERVFQCLRSQYYLMCALQNGLGRELLPVWGQINMETESKH